MKLKLFSIFCAFTYLLTSISHANDIAIDYTNFVQQQMKEQNIPAFSVLIFENENILLEENFGLSNVEKNLQLTADHVFLMASVSKMITAAALLQLYDQNKFDLDDPINPFLPFEVNNPHHQTAITFRHLLTHTSSIADGEAMDSQYHYGQDSPVALEYYMKNYFTPKGEFYSADQNFYNHKPGQDYQYSNEASALIGVLVKQISGQDFISYTHENIFKPLGMTNSHWRLDAIKAPIATPYEDGMPIEHYTFTDYPNGGLRSNAHDMHKFLAMLANQGKFNAKQILKPYTVEQIFTLQILELDYSMGLHIFKLLDTDNLWGHEGGERGATTMVGVNPDNGVGAIILTNKSDAEIVSMFEGAYLTGLDIISFSKND